MSNWLFETVYDLQMTIAMDAAHCTESANSSDLRRPTLSNNNVPIEETMMPIVPHTPTMIRGSLSVIPKY